MKKDYIKPMALEKEMQSEQMLADSILSVEGESGRGKLQNTDAETDASGTTPTSNHCEDVDLTTPCLYKEGGASFWECRLLLLNMLNKF